MNGAEATRDGFEYRGFVDVTAAENDIHVARRLPPWRGEAEKALDCENVDSCEFRGAASITGEAAFMQADQFGLGDLGEALAVAWVDLPF